MKMDLSKRIGRLERGAAGEGRSALPSASRLTDEELRAVAGDVPGEVPPAVLRMSDRELETVVRRGRGRDARGQA